jgi:hypothetical protein
MAGDMPVAIAQQSLMDLDPEKPWKSRAEFIFSMAAFAAVHWTELQRRTHVQGQSLAKLLWNATSPSRVEWYVNNLRILHQSNFVGIKLAGSGTSSCEALHRDAPLGEGGRGCNQGDITSGVSISTLGAFKFRRGYTRALGTN